MMNLLKTNLGRFRIVGFLEGLSLLLLVFVAMPLKYGFDSPHLVESIGPVHGALFVLFVVLAIVIAIKYKWSFVTTGLVLLSTFVPFGTFIADKKIFSKMEE